MMIVAFNYDDCSFNYDDCSFNYDDCSFIEPETLDYQGL
jgi:hypothetical protein